MLLLLLLFEFLISNLLGEIQIAIIKMLAPIISHSLKKNILPCSVDIFSPVFFLPVLPYLNFFFPVCSFIQFYPPLYLFCLSLLNPIAHSISFLSTLCSNNNVEYGRQKQGCLADFFLFYSPSLKGDSYLP